MFNRGLEFTAKANTVEVEKKIEYSFAYLAYFADKFYFAGTSVSGMCRSVPMRLFRRSMKYAESSGEASSIF